MHEVLIYDGIRIHSLQAEDDELLLHVLRSNGFSVYSECGGNGACGKCRVLVKGTGTVTSCLFKIQRSIENSKLRSLEIKTILPTYLSLYVV